MITLALVSSGGIRQAGRIPEPASDRAPSVAGDSIRQQDPGMARGTFSIKVKVDLVTVDAVVRTSRGAFVGDLKTEDFVVYDNGVAQNVTYFSRDQLPLAVALVVDRSPSIAPYLETLRYAAMSAILHLKLQDQIVLFSFDTNVYRHGDLLPNHARIAQQIGQITIGNGTNIYDAVFEAARYLRGRAPDHRRAIILISDNVNSVPGAHRAREAWQEILEAAAALYSIRTPGDNPGIGGRNTDESANVELIAGESGGDVLDVSKKVSLSGALDWAIANLRMQYLLGFSPSDAGKDGSFHNLVVKLRSKESCPDCRVQARRGYYAGKAILPLAPGSTPAAMQPDGSGESLARSRIITAAACGFDLNDIPFELTAAREADDSDQPRIKVDLKIDPANVAFKTEGDWHRGKLRVAIFYADNNGKILGDLWYTVDLNVSEGDFRQFVSFAIPFSQSIPRKAKKQMIRVVVYDPGSDRVGSRLATR
jgi:Ca-activated chloride channel family protein